MPKKSVFTSQYQALTTLLVEARRASGVSQVELAGKLRRPQSFVSKYERGERRLDVIEVIEVARALDIDPSTAVATILASERSAGQPSAVPSGAGRTVFDRWGVSALQVTELVDNNPSLRGILLGYIAEHKFREIMEAIPEVSETRKHDDHDRSRKSDRVVLYKGTEVTIEVKSLQTNSIRQTGAGWTGKAQVDASDRREVTLRNGRKLNTTLLLRGEFDILAVNCFAFRGNWDFAFALNRDLPVSTFKGYTKAQQSQLIASLVPVAWPPQAPFVSDIVPLLELLHSAKRVF